MAIYDFSKQLHHRLGQPFTTASIGLAGIPGLWNHEEDYFKPIKIGTVFELLLLYTKDRKTQQRPPPNDVLSEEDKRDRFSLSYKIRDCKKVDLEPKEVELLKLVISVLGTETNVLSYQFLDNPEV